MADLFTAVRSRPLKTTTTSDDEPGLTAVRTSNLHQETTLPSAAGFPKDSSDVTLPRSKDALFQIRSPEDILLLFRSEPDTSHLLATLSKLSEPGSVGDFNFFDTGPLQTRITSSLVNDILPNFWPTLKAEEQLLLAATLRSLTGINAVLAKLKQTSPSGRDRISDNGQQVTVLIDCLTLILSGNDTALRLSHHADNDQTELTTKQHLMARELATLLGSGKIVSIVAQATDTVKLDHGMPTWLAKGTDFAAWLGRNIATIYQSLDGEIDEVAMRAYGAQVLTKALNIGYPNALLWAMIPLLIDDDAQMLGYMLHSLPMHAKKQLLEQLLRWLSSLTSSSGIDVEKDLENVPSVMPSIFGFLNAVVSDDSAVQRHLQIFLADPILSSSLTYPIRQAATSALATIAPDSLQDLLEKLMATFSARLFIDHAPVLQQESIAQTLLLTAGYLHRHNPMAVLVIARSSSHMQGTSNRLDASGHRARWLGMVVAMAVSSLIDKGGSKMNFGTDEVQTEEAEWYMGLVTAKGDIGDLARFRDMLLKTVSQSTNTHSKPAKKQAMSSSINGIAVFGPARPPRPAQTEVIGEKITELVEEDSDEDDEDLKPYAKPDSDAEDSDEDATLVNRNKARPPVYIRHLMAMLRDDESHDRFQLGMQHAARLIRRKANFGKEVKDHAEELLGILCNLQDPFFTPDFDELKLQAMIAALLSDVEHIGPWLSRQAFVEGYSIAERCIILSALGLGGRELAGFKNEDELNPTISGTDFASTRLPARLHATYTAEHSTSTKLIDTASRKIEDQLMQPLALKAADVTTAHLNAVKVRTFSSRMEVERTKRKAPANQLAKVFGPAFFVPLLNLYQQELAAYGSRSVFSSTQIVLTTFLRTLALLLHASGPATMALPQITTDFWDLLLSLRVQTITILPVLEAVLFALLTLLEVNTDKRRLAQEEAKKMIETQTWVEMVFERTGGGDGAMVGGGGEEEAKVRSLAAGVLIKLREVVEEYQKELFGRVIDFLYLTARLVEPMPIGLPLVGNLPVYVWRGSTLCSRCKDLVLRHLTFTVSTAPPWSCETFVEVEVGCQSFDPSRNAGLCNAPDAEQKVEEAERQ
ncbi:telomere binding protein [Recurvomyces mirabilis]|uniref:Telomere binding protein n=1 Tax=Recurvomyces mirabilis TaxID=574656 RepID=A0AAE0TQH3_9PEZI|nr:telomere binding protein [Recurvomyces mirabilis]KAK5155760.1 telomere binding protein [Recurvomyces mirabilis]